MSSQYPRAVKKKGTYFAKRLTDLTDFKCFSAQTHLTDAPKMGFLSRRTHHTFDAFLHFRPMPIQDNPLFRRLHKHAQKRLVFDPGVSRSKQLPAYKRYIELESEMLKRYHQKGTPGLEVCQARAAMVDVVIENLFLAALQL